MVFEDPSSLSRKEVAEGEPHLYLIVRALMCILHNSTDPVLGNSVF